MRPHSCLHSRTVNSSVLNSTTVPFMLADTTRQIWTKANTQATGTPGLPCARHNNSVPTTELHPWSHVRGRAACAQQSPLRAPDTSASRSHRCSCRRAWGRQDKTGFVQPRDHENKGGSGRRSRSGNATRQRSTYSVCSPMMFTRPGAATAYSYDVPKVAENNRSAASNWCGMQRRWDKQQKQPQR